MAALQFTVTGPDVEHRYPSRESGLSGAITFASRAAKAKEAVSYYVRDKAGNCTGRAESDGTGGVLVYAGGF